MPQGGPTRDPADQVSHGIAVKVDGMVACISIHGGDHNSHDVLDNNPNRNGPTIVDCCSMLEVHETGHQHQNTRMMSIDDYDTVTDTYNEPPPCSSSNA